MNKVISHSNKARVFWPFFKLVTWFPFCCIKLLNSGATPGLSTFHCRNTTLRNPPAWSQLPEPLPFKPSPNPLKNPAPSSPILTRLHFLLFKLDDFKVKCFQSNSNILISSLDYCSATSAKMAPNSWRLYQVCVSASALRLPGVKASTQPCRLMMPSTEVQISNHFTRPS